MNVRKLLNRSLVGSLQSLIEDYRFHYPEPQSGERNVVP